MILRLLLLILFFLVNCHLAEENELVFHSLRVTKNVGNHLSVRMHVQSPDLPLLHLALRFSSNVNIHHYSLLIDQSSMPKYRLVADDVRHKLLINSRGVHKRFSFHTVQQDASIIDANADGLSDKLYQLIQSMRLFAASATVGTSYDGVMLLDLYSSLWQEYNFALFRRNSVTFRFSLDPRHEIAQISDEFHSHLTIECNTAFQEDKCLVQDTGIAGLEVNKRLYATYRLLIDLDSPVNLLPLELFLQWHKKEERGELEPFLNVSWQNKTLLLDRRFRYEMHESNLIVLGVDLLHHFPCLFYTISPSLQIHLFLYERHEADLEQRETIGIVLIFFNFLLLFSLFLWGTSYNYNLVRYIVFYGRYARVSFFFAFKQVLFEILTILLALALVVITLFCVSEQSDLLYHQRKSLLLVMVGIQTTLLSLIVLAYPQPLKKAIRYYFLFKRPKTVVCLPGDARPYWSFFSHIECKEEAEQMYNDIVGAYHDPPMLLPTRVMIMRNLVFISLSLASLLLLVNFYTPEENLHLLVMVILSLALICYQTLYITLGVLFLSLFPCRRWATQRSLILFLAFQAFLLFLYIIFSYESVFVAAFKMLNSTYPRAVIDVYCSSFLTIVVFAGVFRVGTTFDVYADRLFDAFCVY